MELELARHGPIPLYKQIAEYYCALIEKDILKEGEPLPNQRELANQLGVNRSTISNAYSELWSRGLIYSKQGRGTKVISQNPSTDDSINWRHYHNKGNNPPSSIKIISRKIAQAAQISSYINFATGNLSLDSLGIMDFRNYQNRNIDKSDFSIILDQLFHISAKQGDFLLTGGYSQALFLIASAFLKRDDVVAVERPSSLIHHPILKELGVRIIPINMDENGLIPEHLKFLSEQNKIKMLFTQPSFQEPTGTLLPLDRRKQLLAICKKKRIPIVETVCMNPLYHKEIGPPSLYSLADDKSLIINAGGFKGLLGDGYKMGWILAPNHSYDLLSIRQQELGMAVSPMVVKIVGNLLRQENIKDHLERFRYELEVRKNIMMDLLNKNNVEVHNTQGGTGLWCKIPSIKNEELFLAKCMANGVVFMPGGLYGANSSFFRLSFAVQDIHHMDLGITRLAKCMNELV
jgi:GntR family transcriptional regulator of abcA and norABC